MQFAKIQIPILEHAVGVISKLKQYADSDGKSDRRQNRCRPALHYAALSCELT